MSCASAIHLPEYGPFQRGRDSVAEIIETVADIAELAPADQRVHFDDLLIAYPAAAFADALLFLANGYQPAHQERAARMSGAPPT